MTVNSRIELTDVVIDVLTLSAVFCDNTRVNWWSSWKIAPKITQEFGFWKYTGPLFSFIRRIKYLLLEGFRMMPDDTECHGSRRSKMNM